MMMRRLRLCAPFALGVSTLGLAEGVDRKTSFENAPWISARAASLGEALSSTANGLDAVYYNPALIGGVHEKSEKPLLTHLYVPYLGSSVAPDSQSLLTDRLTGSRLDSDAIAEDVQGAWSGDRKYARASITPAVIFNRLFAGYTYSTSTSVYKDETDPEAPLLHLSERVVSGPLLGFSATAPKEEFYLGVSVAFLNIKETEAGFSESDFLSRDARREAIRSGQTTYEGMPIHIGSAYRFKHVSKPTISAVIQDIGSTRYSPSNRSLATKEQKENATIGFSVSPPIAKYGTLHLITEVTSLTDADVKFSDKIRASSEFTMGDRFGADAGLSVRLGYSSAGMSYGAGVNLGILHAEIASFAEDIGIEKSKVIERKSVVNIGFNIADY